MELTSKSVDFVLFKDYLRDVGEIVFKVILFEEVVEYNHCSGWIFGQLFVPDEMKTVLKAPTNGVLYAIERQSDRLVRTCPDLTSSLNCLPEEVILSLWGRWPSACSC